ncbi:MAG: AbrB/MazE/SpoVT family DNA-binding domain-containing protein [Actinomycetales bacterium]|nr:AbrB/MazE/SpoVT family DNA-binding domain-containing protein [Actinomycetales bacterium]
MGTFVSVQNRGTIALPAAARKRYHLDQPGAQVEVIEREGEIVLRPKLPVDADQAWFWSAEWQRGERRASAEADAGLGTVHESGEDLLTSLD